MTRNGASVARTPSPGKGSEKLGRQAAARLATEAAVPVASHVHELHDLLARRIEGAPARKWSARATVSFIALVCGGFWFGLALAIHMLVH